MYLPCLSVQTGSKNLVSSSRAFRSHATFEAGTCSFVPPLCSQNSSWSHPHFGGTILSGVMRALVLVLLSHHPHTTTLPKVPLHIHIRSAERMLTLSELFAVTAAGMLQEAFCVGTATVVISAARIVGVAKVMDTSSTPEV